MDPAPPYLRLLILKYASEFPPHPTAHECVRARELNIGIAPVGHDESPVGEARSELGQEE
jgi:hypothetical protein